jgi:hypothetical protein
MIIQFCEAMEFKFTLKWSGRKVANSKPSAIIYLHMIARKSRLNPIIRDFMRTN